ncbi:MAG: RluA family pseudouridine synthase [Deltaproteobacteria bacterium]|nr:MAG: RluA family pseudouridine synthase [Deltaproteobacteria bacterium]
MSETPPNTDIQRYTTTEEWGGRRLDAIVKANFDVSWNKAREWIQRGKVSCNDKVVLDLGQELPTGTIITLTPDAPSPAVLRRLRKEDVLFVDRHLIVVRKSTGLLSVPFEDDDNDSMEHRVRAYLTHLSKKKQANHSKGKSKGKRKSTGRNRGPASVFTVHRLDKGTSGVMVFARTPHAQEGLIEQFREHTTSRRYLALVHGHVEDTTYRSFLVRDRGDGKRGSVENALSTHVRLNGRGKLAITHVRALEHLPTATLVECHLETGRTNQIRIHLSEAGHLIIGDGIYKRGFKGDRIDCERLMLHALSLGLKHPVTGQELFFEDPLPEDFNALLQILRNPPPKAAPTEETTPEAPAEETPAEETTAAPSEDA